ncbi:1,4-dihydroxy-2-naphthoate octaprenyltransferase [Arthrobacter crystallopoietes BAB-32]|uniref:1,4-dihydroxy-2-naphthoate octaprenyltransferase n=1 Tax=Arthrobacter crystallopoietes BAB-32 TaxID=1246476 RepID=N1UVX6_9MICC|nr:1,4-dihydroxy-2-naphthoate polyprenyltransferase [Arthrobacter crystallopoietes]EMY34556.1 1,4-dihydroxy-2-naphthoate octaprenyltransferase [Arthrobacter crystallopoietes BAB-32]
MATAAHWIEGARLRTLPLGIAPVIVGSAAAYDLEAFHPLRALLALLIAVLFQVGVNYANDYSDGIRGTDDVRVGPVRLTASGLASPRSVKYAAFGCFGAAMLCGLLLVILSGTWPLLLVGVGCVLAAWGYTGGKNPYGYIGLGEVFVFLFFGIVATMGTTYTQALAVSWSSFLGAVSIGLLASALLMANNVRDIPTDREAGKKTLAVRIGDDAARVSYVMMLALALLLPLLLVNDHPWILLVLLVAPLCITPSWVMLRGHRRQDLIPVLKQTGVVSLCFAAAFTLGMVLTQLV